MAKKSKKGFATMDFLIVGGIAAVAYFLFSSFSKGPITDSNTGSGGGNDTGTNAGNGTNTNNTGGSFFPTNVSDFKRFNDTERGLSLTKGGVGLSSNSEMVRAMQMFLKKAGYDIGIAGADGIFGDNTEAALKNYLRWTSFLPVATDLNRLGIRAIKISTNQIFGYDPNGIFQTGVYDEYLGAGRGWVQTTNSIMATNNNL